LTEQQRKEVSTISMDMWKPYLKAAGKR